MRIRLKHIVCYLLLFTVLSIAAMLYSLHHISTIPAIHSVHGNAAIIQDILCRKFAAIKTSTTTKKQLELSPFPPSTPPVTSFTEALSRVKKTPDFKNIPDVLKSLKNDLFVNTSIYDPVIAMYRGDVNSVTFNRNFSLYNNEDFKLLRRLFPVSKTRNIPHEDRIEKQMSVGLKSETIEKLILTYNKDDNLNTGTLQESKCKVTNCRFTNDRRDIYRADAVIFRFIHERVRRPENKSDQLWIFSQLESAASIRNAIKTNEFVNWTATYRSDSVLNTPYAKFKPFANISRLPLSSYIDYAKGKTKLAAWFVSNCGATNGRMDYVLQLQRFARIDVYGTCGSLKCSRLNNNCFEMLKKDYKFYLAFENSNCRDYITEKFFQNALENNVIPIVMGAHPDDYKKLAPPHSYIHVDEFNSPRQLAEYMHILDSNDKLYNSYFRWKNTGEFIDTKFICRLCAMVQLAPSFPMWYKDVNTWWRDNACVVRAKHEEWSTWKVKRNVSLHGIIIP